MPLLDIAIAQTSFQNHCGCTRLQLSIIGKGTRHSWLQCEERWASFCKSSQNPGKMNFHVGYQKKLHPRFLVKAVATFEPKCSLQSENGGKESSVSQFLADSVPSTSSGSDSEEIDAKEKLRRMRISRANKGNTPWNKGKKHSPETIQRIREKTKIAMQNPKVIMQLPSIRHAQSQETKQKIGVGVRMGWKRRHQRLLLQETCLFDWQNLIADASRKGFHDEEELQWDSYEILSKQLQQKWLDSIEYRKTMPRPKSNKRAPKSLEQRQKIAEAIAAKWADPEYRARVCSGLAKYHGTPEGPERNAKKKPSSAGQSKSPKKKVSDPEKSASDELKARAQQPKLKKQSQYVPKYKDPLASSKLEILRSIRAQRAASETKMNETLEQAKILIAEAEKAAEALEVAAMRSPVAQASLIETRRLIAEATHSIETIEEGKRCSNDEAAPRNPPNHVEKNGNAFSGEYPKGINGIAFLQSHQDQNPDFDLYEWTMMNKMDMSNHLRTGLDGYEFPELKYGNPTTCQFRSHHSKVSGDLNISSLTFASKETNLERSTTEHEHSDTVAKSDLTALSGQHHYHPETNGVARLNGSSALNRAKTQIQRIPASKRVIKKWLRGRLIEVIEGD